MAERDPFQPPSYSDAPQSPARQHERVAPPFAAVAASAALVTSGGSLRITLVTPDDADGNDYRLVAVRGDNNTVTVDADAQTVTLEIGSGATVAQVQAVVDADAALTSAYEGGEDGTGTFSGDGVLPQAVNFGGGQHADRTLRRVSKGVRVETAGRLVCHLVDDEADNDLDVNVVAGEPLDIRVDVVRSTTTATIDAWT